MARKKEKICFGQKSVVSARKRQSTDFVGDDVVGESVGGGPRRRRRGVGCSDVRRMLLEVRLWATGRVVCYADCKQDKNVFMLAVVEPRVCPLYACIACKRSMHSSLVMHVPCSPR
jgi:hypothetical protein